MARSGNNNGANVGFEAELWKAADALRGSMDAAEYKHVVLGLLFLKYISDAFEEQHTLLEADRGKGADPEDPDEYRAVNTFWVPKDARWSLLKANAKQATIGQMVDEAMTAIERDNPSLKGVLPKDYARPGLDKTRLGQLVDMVSNIAVGDRASRSKDVLGRTYEYFLSQFASAEGKKGGEFYTPQCVVRLLVEMLSPYRGRVYDPCCGSGGMFVQSEKFIEEHGGRIGDISVWGQESNYTTWRLAKMNLAIRGIDANIAHGDTFHRDGHPDLKADYVLANPPFNDSDWKGDQLRDDKRWVYGPPPRSNANFAWIQHILSHLSPRGTAGFVLANGSMSTVQAGQGEIREGIIDADLVDCMIALPGHLFYSNFSQVCIWVLARDKRTGRGRDCSGETLFIDARSLGVMTDRTHRELRSEDIDKVARCYHVWRGDVDGMSYEDETGFSAAATLDQVKQAGRVLSPGRFVGSSLDEDELLPVDVQVRELAQRYIDANEECRKRDGSIAEQLDALGINVSGVNRDDWSESSRADLGRLASVALEQIERRLFRSWFVDFDPVRARSEFRADFLPPALLSRFPDAFEDTLIGEVPAGWHVGCFGDVLTPRKERAGDLELLEYSATVRGLELRSQRFNKRLSKSSAKNKIIRRGDLVFGMSRTSLSFGLMTDEVGAVSPVYEVFSVNAELWVPRLLEQYIRTNMSAHMDVLKPGAREGQTIDRDYLLSKELLFPDIELQRTLRGVVYGC